MNTTRIIKEVEINQFKEIIDKYKSKIIVSPHAFDHLSNAQRKIFSEADLINPLLKENPSGIGMQKNERYAVFYRRNWGYLKIILAVSETQLDVISFINTETIPNLKRLSDEE